MNIRFPKKSFIFLATLNTMVNKHETGRRNYPLLIGCGKFDIPMELEAIKAWKNNEPDCTVVFFENAGHCVNMDVPQEFNKTMEEFWKGASPIFFSLAFSRNIDYPFYLIISNIIAMSSVAIVTFDFSIKILPPVIIYDGITRIPL